MRSASIVVSVETAFGLPDNGFNDFVAMKKTSLILHTITCILNSEGLTLLMQFARVERQENGHRRPMTDLTFDDELSFVGLD